MLDFSLFWLTWPDDFPGENGNCFHGEKIILNWAKHR
jgi:hypothetical protein